VNLTATAATGVRYQRRSYRSEERASICPKPCRSTYGERTKKEGLRRHPEAGRTSLVWDDAKYNFARARERRHVGFTRQT
jgi:hypothetical protein